jgi:ABC-type branched-subunit amino acid transport system substrate-binding protein
MRLSRIERIFFGVFAVQLIFTLGFGIAIYRALTTTPSTATAVRVGGTDSGTSQDLPAGDASGAAASSSTAGGAASGSTGSTGSGAATGTTGGAGTGAAAAAGSAATRGITPQKAATVAPSVCPFANGQLSIGSIVEQSGLITTPEVANAAKAFFQDANLHGGVHGCKVTDTILDDANNPTTALNDAKQLVGDDHVFSIVSMESNFGQTAGVDNYFANPGADNNGQPVPVIGLDPYESLAYQLPNEFGTDVPLYDAGVSMVSEAVQFYGKGGFTHPGLFGYDLDQVRDAINGFQAGMKSAGYNNLDVKMINASNGGYDAVAKQFVADGVDLITWFTDIGGGLRFTQAMDNAGYKGKWVVFSIGYDPRYSTQFGGSGGQVNGAPVVSNYLPFESNSAEIQTIRTTVNRYFPGTLLNSVMVQGWTGARVFATEMNRLALTPDRNADQKLLIDALGAETALDLGGLAPPLNFTLGADHSGDGLHGRVGHRCIQFLVINNSQFEWRDHTWHCPNI